MSALHAQPCIFLRETAAMLTSIPSLDANFTTPLSETAPPALCVFKLSKNGSFCLPSPSDQGGEWEKGGEWEQDQNEEGWLEQRLNRVLDTT